MQFEPLGVVCDLGEIDRGRITVSNKPGRIDQILDTVNAIIRAGTISGRQAASLKGRINFAEQQCHGKLGVLASSVLSARAAQGSAVAKLSTDEAAALNWLKSYMRASGATDHAIQLRHWPVCG